jgi:predicted nucleic acid-binding protein
MATKDDKIVRDAPVFVDTNILVYAQLEDEPFYEVATERLEEVEEQASQPWISRQIVREYLAVMTRQVEPKAIATPALLDDVRGFAGRFRVADEDAPITERLL